MTETPENKLQQQGEQAFNRDKFLLKQKMLSFSEKYYVWDEENKKILFIERPAHNIMKFCAAFLGIMTWFIITIGLFMLSRYIHIEIIKFILIFTGIFGGIAAALTVSIIIMPKRHVTFYKDDTMEERLLFVMQDAKIHILNATYSIADIEGNLLGKLRKNYIYDIFRKKWYCYNPDGSLLCVANEDSIILSILRRTFGSLFGLLRTNFIIFDATETNVLGEFNRKLTILDHYVLDMTADTKKVIDRRIAIALGVMLDTGENR